MRPATAVLSDGPQNLLDAMAVARTAGARGVVAVCAGVIHDALDVAKQHTYRLDAFSSGDAGPIGYVEEGRVRLLRDWPVADGLGAEALGTLPESDRWPRVEIVMNHAGAGGGVVGALVAQGVDGLVVAGTGNGTLHHELETALHRAQARGVKVVRSTRCAQGRVLARPDDTLPDSRGLSPVKARIALILELLRPSSPG
jgi:L-asparaginase